MPLLTGFSLLTGFTLSGIVALAIGTIGIGSVGTAALATGITFVIASYTGQRMSDSVGQALSGVVGLGLIGLLIAMFVQLIGGFFAPGFWRFRSRIDNCRIWNCLIRCNVFCGFLYNAKKI